MLSVTVSILLGILIFGYAAWMLVKQIQTSRKGKCAACAIKNACGQTDCQCSGQGANEHPATFK